MPEKQVIILHPCHFTSRGLQHLLPSTDRVYDMENITQCQHYLFVRRRPDLVILTLHSTHYSVLEGLCLVSALYYDYPQCQVLVMMTAHQTLGLKGFFAQFCARVKVIDPCADLSALARAARITPQRYGRVPRAAYARSPKLSPCEYQLLDGLLAGKSVREMVIELAINEKEVSYYKLQALTKLKVERIGALVAGSTLPILNLMLARPGKPEKQRSPRGRGTPYSDDVAPVRHNTESVSA